MKLLSQEETKRICDRVMSFTKADECIVSLGGNRTGNIRYARNNVSTAGLVEDTQLAVQVAFGKRQGTVTVNEFDDKSLQKAVRTAEDLARLAPENPEFMPAVAKQAYRPSNTFSKATAAIDPEFRAQTAAYSIEASRKNKLVAAGFFTDNASFQTVANSNGVFGHQDSTSVDFTCTVRTEDGRGSGWVKRSATDVARFDAREASNVAIEKALRSVEAKALEPGRYTVILEPAATSDLIGYMLAGFDARFGGITVLPIAARAGEAAMRVLIRGIKGSRAPMRLLAPFVLHEAEGRDFRPEADAIFRGTGRLDW